MPEKTSVREDIFIGLCYYAIEDRYGHIPHYIKFSDDSFRVEELINEELIGNNGYYLYKYEKDWGIDSSYIEKYVAKYNGKVLGKKDKYSKALQYIISKKRIHNKNFKLIGKVPKDVKIPEIHIGNRFILKIKVSDSYTYLNIIKERIKKLTETFVPNYYGYQRFGRNRINHIIGFDLIKEVFKDKINWNLEKNRLKLYLNAFQSYIFNHSLNKMIEKREFDSIKYPVLGYAIRDLPIYTYEVISTLNLNWSDLKKTLYKLRYSGVDLFGSLRRTAINFIEAPIIMDHYDDIIEVKFAISRGQYATIVLREILKPKNPSIQGY